MASESAKMARATWSAGNWDEIANYMNSVGDDLLDRAGVESGMEVLDVGTGSGGTLAIPAAKRGAKVVGSDVTPELFDAARRRAAEAGVDVEWIEADAADLPFEDASFDRVFSTFGHMFAQGQEQTAAEMARVLRPGGAVATATWPLHSLPGKMFPTVAKHLPPPPESFEPPLLWGTEDHARALWEGAGLAVEFGEGTFFQTEESVEKYHDVFRSNFPPMARARQALGDGFAALAADLDEVEREFNESDDGSVRMRMEYLVTVARKPG